jgi:hypothetical protein
MEESFLSATECTVHRIIDVRLTEIHTAEPLLPKPRAYEFGTAAEKLTSHKPPGDDQIPPELITAAEGTFVLRSTNL